MADQKFCVVCGKRAYFQKGANTFYCGRHAKTAEATEKLPPRDLRREFAEHQKSVVAKQPGQNALTLQRMFMIRTPTLRPGAVMIFPNNRHGQHPFAAFDCSGLSPMRLGPVEHGQPGLPPAVNIENFHQGSKVYQEEVDKDGNPTDLYYKNRRDFYLDPIPHRHKYMGDSTTGNKNIPLYFLWVSKDGKENRLTYVESRQFYCTFYERLVTVQPAFLRLKQMWISGYDIEICGYDGHPMPENDVEAAYLDSTKPFGHERVLAAILLEKCPWHKYKTFEF